MKVDMSPEAVTQRLRTMDDLWLLSMKLMNSKAVIISADKPRKVSASEIQDSIRQVLCRDWDPIGVADEGLDHEYDSYLAPVYRILVGSRSEDEIVNYLYETERNTIGVWCENPEMLRPIAKKLLLLDVLFKEAK